MRLGAALLVLGIVLGGCVSTRPPLRSAPVELTDVPFFAQTAYQCGPAALATVLNDSGLDILPADITSDVFIPDRKGSLQIELVAAARRHGRLPYLIEGDVEALLTELEAGRPVLVLQNLAFRRWPKWHYAVVVGYLPGRDRFVLRSGRKERRQTPTGLFAHRWSLADSWGFVVLDEGELPASASADGWVRTLAASEGRIDPEFARAGYEAGLARWPDNPLLLFAAANFHYGSGDQAGALKLYRHVLELEPAHPAARNNLANLLLERGCVTQARLEIDRALADLPADDPLRPALEDTRNEARAADEGSAECRQVEPGSDGKPEDAWQ
ncbi:PA2778 family cysteine peptidase [Elongatibacter sediminis]|uniref:PA2778 family cysteine peptidase n=1 Tax=Elongatibacter sediminis TaxID=3119006 RepID=A0AAW9RB62_9GAMM